MIAALAGLALAGEVQRYAVVVGTNEGLESDTPLLYAERDAERVADVLVELGDIRSEDVLDLRDVDADRVRDALRDLAGRVERRKGGAEALLFFYYSGHGDEDGLRLSGTVLPFADLTELLHEIPVDVRVLVVDACQSGELTRLKGAVPAEPFEIRAEDRLDTEGMAIITSSSIGEDAQESDRLQGGIFTHHFVAGLMGAADASGDHRITLTEAYRYGYAETVRSTSRARFVQRPSFGFQLSGRSDLVLTRVEDPGRNAMLALSGPGQWLVFEGTASGEIVAEVSVERDALLSVTPGDYLVRYRSDRGIREESVDVPRGETRELVAKDMGAISPGETVRKGIEEHKAALALTFGGGMLGPTGPSLPPSAVGHVGLMADFEALTVATRLVGSGLRASNEPIVIHQARIGLDVAGIKKIDAGIGAFGLGVRAGGDLTNQWFDTTGDAPSRRALTGRLGPLLSLDVPLGRTLVVLSGGTDVQLYRRYDVDMESSPLATQVVPTVSLELAHYVR
ncbi:MAG: caspase family protein [Alphaproteobacteria bacterium]|nr:caspase family protein [Alphaproteobacteria bacterium]